MNLQIFFNDLNDIFSYNFDDNDWYYQIKYGINKNNNTTFCQLNIMSNNTIIQHIELISLFQNLKNINRNIIDNIILSNENNTIFNQSLLSINFNQMELKYIIQNFDSNIRDINKGILLQFYFIKE